MMVETAMARRREMMMIRYRRRQMAVEKTAKEATQPAEVVRRRKERLRRWRSRSRVRSRAKKVNLIPSTPSRKLA